jgi:hypothetical protein
MSVVLLSSLKLSVQIDESVCCAATQNERVIPTLEACLLSHPNKNDCPSGSVDAVGLWARS